MAWGHFLDENPSKTRCLGSGLITRRGQWRLGGWQNGRGGRSGRSGLQWAASPSVGKKDSRFCDACDIISCCNALVSCGSDGAGCKAGCPAGSASYGLCPCHPLDSPSPCRRRQVLAHHISTGEVTALPLTQVESQGTTFAVTDPMELAGHAPLGATNQAGGTPPVLRRDAVGWALMSVASIISTSGSGASGSSAESDTDNSEKIGSKTPLSHQRRQRLSRVLWGAIDGQGIHPAQPLLKDMDDAA